MFEIRNYTDVWVALTIISFDSMYWFFIMCRVLSALLFINLYIKSGKHILGLRSVNWRFPSASIMCNVLTPALTQSRMNKTKSCF